MSGTNLNIIETPYTATASGNGGTLLTAGYGIGYYDPGGSSRTGVILEAGTENGQKYVVVNAADQAETITFATDSTSNVAGGTAIVVGQNEGKSFYWNTTLARWLPESVISTGDIPDATITPAKTNIVEARTATAAPGGTTGVISDTSTYVQVTCDDANKVITLPTPTPGRMVIINVGANGFELRSSDPATIAINGGTGANAESAIAANSTILAICITATAWKAIFLDADSDVAKVEAAA